MSYRGEPVEQAKCLMRSMDATRNLAPMLEGLPSALASRVGQDGGLPTREALSTLLSKQDLEWDFAYFLWQPIARANDNDPAAPMARYFVIHDTSGPNFGHHAFPDDINVNPKINNLDNFKCNDGWGRAHIVISRSGGMLVNHDYGIPWRETKFERAVNFNGALKGLFVHNELIQPRRAASGHGRYNDAQTPDPGFTAAQYDRLALALHHRQRASGRWLIPAFHAAIDAGIPNGHDDPLNFSIASFADSLQKLIDQLNGGGAAVARRRPAPAHAARGRSRGARRRSCRDSRGFAGHPAPKPVDALDRPAPQPRPDADNRGRVETKPTAESRQAPSPQPRPSPKRTPRRASAAVETRPSPPYKRSLRPARRQSSSPATAAKPETEAETKPEPAAETKPETKSESEAAPKSEAKPEAALEAETKAKREAARRPAKRPRKRRGEGKGKGERRRQEKRPRAKGERRSQRRGEKRSQEERPAESAEPAPTIAPRTGITATAATTTTQTTIRPNSIRTASTHTSRGQPSTAARTARGIAAERFAGVS